MRKRKTETMDEVVASYLKYLGLDVKMKEMRLINSWPEVVGKTIAKATTHVNFKGGTLFVSLKSSVVKNELMMLREGLKKALNEKAGEELVKKIVLR